MAIDSERTEPRSRRAILAGAIGGVAAVVASRFASPDKASAAAGGPVIMGAANSAGVTNTSLATTSTGTALLVTQNGAGTALRGSAVGAGSIAGFFTAQNGTGVSGVTGNRNTYGVFASNNGASDGTGGALRASGVNNHGIVATTAHANAEAIIGTHLDSGAAIVGTSIAGINSFGVGVQGGSDGSNGSGVVGFSNSASGDAGAPANGVWGSASTPFGNGVLGQGPANGYGVYSGGNAHVQGNLTVSGSVTKGSGAFKIDHPLDPANKFLVHSFVESPDMKNVYDGVATLDAKGEATVKLPAWFEKVNKDFRYQLTAMGPTDRVLYVKSKLKGNAFAIGGGTAGQEVSWQITGIRQDAFANANRIVNEVAKTGAEKGRYLHPKEHGQPESKSIGALRAPPAIKAR